MRGTHVGQRLILRAPACASDQRVREQAPLAWYTGGCKLLLRLNVAMLHSVFVSLLDSAAVATGSKCPSINVRPTQVLCMLVVAVV
jgi:hypothetical protein